MTEEIKRLNFNDKMNMIDKKVVTQHKNKAIFKDKQTGEVLFIKNNIVVFDARIFTLENISKTSYNEPTVRPKHVTNFDRKICLFKVGTGGAPITDPFNPYTPNVMTSDLVAAVPFREVIPNLGESLTEAEREQYYLETVTNTPEGNQYSYLAKRVNIDTGYRPQWNVDPDTNLVSLVYTLNINLKEVRDEKINELGMFLAQEISETDGTVSFADIEMFSYITFDTESMRDRKAIEIEYHIFA